MSLFLCLSTGGFRVTCVALSIVYVWNVMASWGSFVHRVRTRAHVVGCAHMVAYAHTISWKYVFPTHALDDIDTRMRKLRHTSGNGPSKISVYTYTQNAQKSCTVQFRLQIINCITYSNFSIHMYIHKHTDIFTRVYKYRHEKGALDCRYRKPSSNFSWFYYIHLRVNILKKV